MPDRKCSSRYSQVTRPSSNRALPITETGKPLRAAKHIMKTLFSDSLHAVWAVAEARGPPAIIVGLSAYVGTLWAGRIARRGEAKLSKELEHLKTELRRQDQKIEASFDVGVMSHMANVAFDKHIEFCEAYLKESDQALAELLLDASAKTTLAHVGKLAEIRRQYALWEDKKIGDFLTKFQESLSKIWLADPKA